MIDFEIFMLSRFCLLCFCFATLPLSQALSSKAQLDLLIATPCRLLQLHQQGAVSLGLIEHLILDEADLLLGCSDVVDSHQSSSSSRSNSSSSDTYAETGRVIESDAWERTREYSDWKRKGGSKGAPTNNHRQ